MRRHHLMTIVCCQHLNASLAFPCTVSGPDVSVIRSYNLHGNGIDPRCTISEVHPAPRDPNAEDDDVELYYPTTRRAFACARLPHKLLHIRQTSFGCGRLGATVWPSAIALACLLTGDGARPSLEGRRVLELGAGCGMPSLVAKELCRAQETLATDYWEEDAGGPLSFDGPRGDRLVPTGLFGANLAYNIAADATSSVARLDWHDEAGIFKVARDFRPDVIIGSDLVYYPMDTPPLLQTLEILLRAGGAQDALLISPLRPPYSEREALPDFRSLLENGALGDGCDVTMDELVMVATGINKDEERNSFLRIRVHLHHHNGTK